MNIKLSELIAFLNQIQDSKEQFKLLLNQTTEGYIVQIMKENINENNKAEITNCKI